MRAQKNRLVKAFAGIMGGLMIAFAVSVPAGAAQVCLNNGSSSTPLSKYIYNSVCKTSGTCQTAACKKTNCVTASNGCNTAGCKIYSNGKNCRNNLSGILSSLTGRDVSQIQQMLKNGTINFDMIQNLCPTKGKVTGSKKLATKQTTKAAKPTTPSKATTDKTPTAPSNSGTTTTTTPTGVTAMEQQMVNLVNSERAKAGVAPLKIDVKLTHVAEVKAKDMIDNHYFSHTSPTYGSPFDMMKTFGITYRTAGENIAMNQTVQAAHTAFMNSPGHRANILNSSFTSVGIGIISDGKGNIYISQMFIGN